MGGRERTRGGSEKAIMLGRERASVEEGRVEGGSMTGTSEGGTGRVMDGGREEARGCMRESSEEGMEQG